MANATGACPAPWAAVSNGAWSGNNPIHYALPLLTIQLCLVLVFSRALAYIFKPLRQPRVIAEIIGGVLLGPTAMGYIPGFSRDIFPPASLTVLETVANMGLIFFLFMVGLELDLRALRRTGRAALTIAVAGVSLPFALGVAGAYAFRSILGVHSKFGPFLVFMGVATSITAFPVLARILAERKLLTTDVGQMAMSAAAVNDVAAWILLALAIALSNPDSNSEIVAWILLCGIAFVLVQLFAVRPLMALLARHAGDPIPEVYVAVTLVLVLVSAFTTDVIGIHGIFGAFVFGLVIPKDGPFAGAILEKIEDFVSIILLPLYFADSGLKTKLESISGGNAWGLVFLSIALACLGKVGGTMLAAMANRIPVKKSLVLGILMNTKGLVELIVLNIGLQKKILTQEIFSIMVLMALATTFMTTPLVMLLYEPAREKEPYTKRKLEGADEELRMVVCCRGSSDLPAMLNVTELTRGNRRRPLKAFLLHLVEFSERSSSILLVTKARKEGRPFWSKESEREGGQRDQVVVAFQAFARLSKVTVEPMTAISAFHDMHDDICATAASKRANVIVLPFHKHVSVGGRLDIGSQGFAMVNQRVLRHAPCSVGILVDRGFGGYAQMTPGAVSNRIAVFFFGGPDDREALAIGRRMAEHPGVTLTVFRFVPRSEADVALSVASHLSPGGVGINGHDGTEIHGTSDGNPLSPGGGGSANVLQSLHSFCIPTDKLERESEAKQDEAALAPVRKEGAQIKEGDESMAGDGGGTTPPSVLLDERAVDDPAAAALAIARGGGHDLIVVGRGRRPPPLLAQLVLQQAAGRRRLMNAAGGSGGGGAAAADELSGLGPLGDLLSASGEMDVQASVLVVQQHDPSLLRHKSARQVDDAPASPSFAHSVGGPSAPQSKPAS